MIVQRTILCFAIVSLGFTVTDPARGQTFRGLQLDQGNNVYYAPALDREAPFYIDIKDNFNRDGRLGDSDADELQIGFVPPFEGVPLGPLTGAAADAHGRWMPSQGDYVTASIDGGRVSRVNGAGHSVTCLPWRVEPTLGDDYMIEITASVAPGEIVSLGYFGDIATYGTAQGLDGPLGQLVLSLERGTGDLVDQLTWTIAWDVNGARPAPSNTMTVSEDEQVRMLLGWTDVAGGHDFFDAWLETSTASTRLAQGNMGTAIEVFGVGFEIEDAIAGDPFGNGTGSFITSFTAAVPEPTSGLLIGTCLLAGIPLLRRRQHG